jgi:prolyl-tRNA synthetase
VAAVTEFLRISPWQLVKTMIFMADGQPVAVLLRGDHEIQPVKLKNFLKADEVELASDQECFDAVGVPSGYIGPVGIKLPLVADREVMSLSNFVIGANEKNHHFINACHGRDFEIERTADLRVITKNDRCPLCGAALQLTRGIEVGHIFKLGTAYSKALHAVFLNEKGQEIPFVMGCYGIGVSRVAAAAIEQNHDKDGMIWPLPISPAAVIILNLSPKDEEISKAAEEIYQALRHEGIDVLIDDRDERPGSKFKDADLLGIPFRLTIGTRFAKEGIVEVRQRQTSKTLDVPHDEALAQLMKLLRP